MCSEASGNGGGDGGGGDVCDDEGGSGGGGLEINHKPNSYIPTASNTTNNTTKHAINYS